MIEIYHKTYSGKERVMINKNYDSVLRFLA